ncbi:MAG: iron-sulfur cluster-binding protein [Candidatus Caldatribacteriaceae bacterium]
MVPEKVLGTHEAMKARIQRKSTFGTNLVLLELEEEGIASSVQPGQFVMVRVGEGLDPFLRRPLGVMGVQGCSFTLLFEVVGRGTELLAQKRPGDQIDVLGPFGRGFSLSPSLGILVAGGRGVVPLHFLASKFASAGVPFLFFVGIKSQEELVLLRFVERFSSVYWSCEEKMEGGFCGDVVTLLEQHLSKMVIPSGSRVYTCGPEGMLQVLEKVEAIRDLPIEASLEALMGCGFGVCLGCGVKKLDGEGYYHVCQDGPVFLLSEVKL